MEFQEERRTETKKAFRIPAFNPSNKWEFQVWEEKVNTIMRNTNCFCPKRFHKALIKASTPALAALLKEYETPDDTETIMDELFQLMCQVWRRSHEILRKARKVEAEKLEAGGKRKQQSVSRSEVATKSQQRSEPIQPKKRLTKEANSSEEIGVNKTSVQTLKISKKEEIELIKGRRTIMKQKQQPGNNIKDVAGSATESEQSHLCSASAKVNEERSTAEDNSNTDNIVTCRPSVQCIKDQEDRAEDNESRRGCVDASKTVKLKSLGAREPQKQLYHSKESLVKAGGYVRVQNARHVQVVNEESRVNFFRKNNEGLKMNPCQYINKRIDDIGLCRDSKMELPLLTRESFKKLGSTEISRKVQKETHIEDQKHATALIRDYSVAIASTAVVDMVNTPIIKWIAVFGNSIRSLTGQGSHCYSENSKRKSRSEATWEALRNFGDDLRSNVVRKVDKENFKPPLTVKNDELKVLIKEAAKVVEPCSTQSDRKLATVCSVRCVPDKGGVTLYVRRRVSQHEAVFSRHAKHKSRVVQGKCNKPSNLTLYQHNTKPAKVTRVRRRDARFLKPTKMSKDYLFRVAVNKKKQLKGAKVEKESTFCKIHRRSD